MVEIIKTNKIADADLGVIYLSLLQYNSDIEYAKRIKKRQKQKYAFLDHLRDSN